MTPADTTTARAFDSDDTQSGDDHSHSDSATAPVTIIMSNYNQAQYLHESLGGLVNQSLPAQRILVIDDGSIDNSVEIIREYENRHANLRLIRNKVNLGLQDSIARALPLVDTEYLVWAASDDILLPSFLEKSMAALHKHPRAGLCFSELTVLIDETGDINPFSDEPSVAHVFNLSDLTSFMPPEAVLARMKRSYFPVSGNTVVVHRGRLAACGDFFKDLQWHSDHFAFNAVAVRYGACVIPETLGLIRQRSDSYSASGMHNIHTQRPVLEAMLDLLSRDEFADIRTAFDTSSSYYSVWGVSILRLMMRRRIFWSTALRFSLWQYTQLRLGHQLTHLQAFKRITKRVIHSSLLKGINMPLFGGKARALEAELASVKTQRDGLIAERDKLGVAVHETAQQRDAANLENQRINGVLAALSSSLEETRTELKSLQTDFSQLEKRFDTSTTKLKTATVNLKKVTGELKSTKEELKSVKGELQSTKGELANVTGNLGSVTKELSVITADLDTAGRANTALLEDLAEYEIHQGPNKVGFFAPDTVIYKENEERPDPIVPISTMPKSGTYYLARVFSEGLGLRPMVVSNQYFPEDTIYQPRLREFVKGGYVSQDHFPASEINVTHLAHLLEKLVVHLRDPRQAMLSYIHFLDNDQFNKNLPETRKFIFPTLPEDFYQKDLAGRLDWGIEYWLPTLVAWTQQWVEADETSSISVKFTRFEDLIDDEDKFTNDVLDFLEIPQSNYKKPSVQLDSRVHFRKGEADEWRKVLSPHQVERANALIPDALMERFKWTP